MKILQNYKWIWHLVSWVCISIAMMRGMEHFGASQIEAGFAVVCGVAMMIWGQVTDALTELAPAFDRLIAEWRDRSHR